MYTLHKIEGTMQDVIEWVNEQWFKAFVFQLIPVQNTSHWIVVFQTPSREDFAKLQEALASAQTRA